MEPDPIETAPREPTAPVVDAPESASQSGGEGERVAAALEAVDSPHAESEVHRLLTKLEDEVDHLLHAPVAMAAWVRGVVAEVKSKL